jgi:hypothetical protein
MIVERRDGSYAAFALTRGFVGDSLVNKYLHRATRQLVGGSWPAENEPNGCTAPFGYAFAYSWRVVTVVVVSHAGRTAHDRNVAIRCNSPFNTDACLHFAVNLVWVNLRRLPEISPMDHPLGRH